MGVCQAGHSGMRGASYLVAGLRRVIRRIPIVLAVALAVLLGSLALTSPASADREVRVGTWSYPPQVSQDAEGRPVGIFVDIVEAVGARHGWRITYVFGTWEDTLSRLESGEIDLGLGVGQVAMRRAQFTLSREPVVSDWGQLFTRGDERVETVLDLEGKIVTGWKDDRTFRSLRHLARTFGVDARYVATNSMDENFAMVADGRADAVVELRVPGRAAAKKHGLVASPVIFSPITFGFATQKGQNADLIAALDSFIAEGKDAPGSEYDQIMEKWLGTPGDATTSIPTGVVVALAGTAVLAALFVVWSLLLRHQVDRRTRALRAERDMVASLMETSPVGIVLVGNDGRVRLANARAEELFGRPRADGDGRGLTPSVEEVFSQSPQAGQLVDEVFSPLVAQAAEVMETGSPVSGVQLTVERTGADPVRVSVNGAPVYAESGELTGALTAIEDVTERERALDELERYREQLEELVGQRTAALEAANEQLESFSYSVSHDLRAPLRALDGFSYALLEDAGAQLDDTSLAYLQRIRSASQHMAELIDALLKLSRAGRADLELTRVSLTDLAGRVAAELSAADPERDVEWTIEPGLEASADPALAEVVVDNLLTNAWKFSAGRSPAHIQIGARETEDGRVFFVRDDGVGFDPACADKLFRPFERLHAREDFPGTGIGLATVRRVLTRHGGRCWAEGAPGRGATVFFTF
jgi:PAS domain S-box-containing protein